MNPPNACTTPAGDAAFTVPTHWTPEQALAVLECLHSMRQALWAAYGPQVQLAWQDQLMPDGPAPTFDPDEPFWQRRRVNTSMPHMGPSLLQPFNTRSHARQHENRHLGTEWQQNYAAANSSPWASTRGGWRPSTGRPLKAENAINPRTRAVSRGCG